MKAEIFMIAAVCLCVCFTSQMAYADIPDCESDGDCSNGEECLLGYCFQTVFECDENGDDDCPFDLNCEVDQCTSSEGDFAVCEAYSGRCLITETEYTCRCEGENEDAEFNGENENKPSNELCADRILENCGAKMPGEPEKQCTQNSECKTDEDCIAGFCAIIVSSSDEEITCKNEAGECTIDEYGSDCSCSDGKGVSGSGVNLEPVTEERCVETLVGSCGVEAYDPRDDCETEAGYEFCSGDFLDAMLCRDEEGRDSPRANRIVASCCRDYEDKDDPDWQYMEAWVECYLEKGCEGVLSDECELYPDDDDDKASIGVGDNDDDDDDAKQDDADEGDDDDADDDDDSASDDDDDDDDGCSCRVR